MKLPFRSILLFAGFAVLLTHSLESTAHGQDIPMFPIEVGLKLDDIRGDLLQFFDNVEPQKTPPMDSTQAYDLSWSGLVVHGLNGMFTLSISKQGTISQLMFMGYPEEPIAKHFATLVERFGKNAGAPAPLEELSELTKIQRWHKGNVESTVICMSTGLIGFSQKLVEPE